MEGNFMCLRHGDIKWFFSSFSQDTYCCQILKKLYKCNKMSGLWAPHTDEVFADVPETFISL